MQFEVLEEIKTGNNITTFFGTKEETKQEWVVYKNVKVVSGAGNSSSPLMVLLEDGSFAWIDLYSSGPDGDNCIFSEAFTRGYNHGWCDMKYVDMYV